MDADPIRPYLAARRVAFQRLQDVRDRTDEWLRGLNLDALDWTAIAHIEGLNAERQQAVDELQAAEREMIASLARRIRHPRPGDSGQSREAAG